MITNIFSENYKNIDKISIIDSKKVFYNLQSVLQKRDINFDDEDALIICPLPEDIKYPSSSKIVDSGQLFSYKVDITITNQSSYTESQLYRYLNKKVILILHYREGKIIIGCNENPLQFLFDEDNSTNPTANNGYSVQLAGNTYYGKVNL